MVRERRAQWPNGRDWGEGEAEGRTLSQPGDQPNRSQRYSQVFQRALGCAWVKGSRRCAPPTQMGPQWHLNHHQVLGLGLGKGGSFLRAPPRSHLQEEARLSELPEITVAVALARVMVRGPVFAAHVEDEWVANAGKKSIRAMRGCPGELAHLPEPEFLGHIGGCASTHLPDKP